MGADIRTLAQRQTQSGWEDLDFVPFDWRGYGMFGFLAGVRNYSGVTPISEPRGLPEDFVNHGEWDDWCDLHATSWLSIEELLAVDYDQIVEDRRCDERGDIGTGPLTAEPGKGERMTLRAFLGDAFFNDLAKLKELSAGRIVFGFSL